MTDDFWASEGADDQMARQPSIPAFLEVEPGTFRAVDACSADELRAAADARTLQARALTEEANALIAIAESK